MDFKQFYKTINFDIDNEIRTVFQATQGDTKSRGLLVDLIVGGVKTPVTTEEMTFFALKPDGTRVMTVGVKEGTGFRIDFTNQTFAVPGVLLCTLVLSGTNGEKISDKKFKMTVDSSLEDGAIISKDERGILDRAFELANDIVPDLEQFNIDIRVDELARKDAEQIRQTTYNSLFNYEDIEPTNNIFMLDMAENDNFAINLEGSCYLTFKNQITYNKNLSSKVVKISTSPTQSTLEYPLCVKFKDNVKPIFDINKTYIMLLQSFDYGVTWLGSVVGEWENSKVVVFDNFNRPNSTNGLGVTNTGQTWEYSGASVWGITDRKAHVVQPDNDLYYDLAYVDTGVEDKKIRIEFDNDETQQNRLVVRYYNPNSFIEVGKAIGSVDEYLIQIAKFVNGAYSDRSFYTVDKFKKGDSLTVIDNGDSLTVYFRDMFLGKRALPGSPKSTKVALMSFKQNLRYFKNLSVEAL